ncbi:MAG: hypothetical protein KDD27_26100, partial [Saprospiraceae bacterium]|nr:hypothetical protein [Saprospiraceae bacterium]
MKRFFKQLGINRNGNKRVPILFILLPLWVQLYSQIDGDFRSKQTGNWTDASTWERFNGTSWVNAPSAPASSDGVITIQNGHTVTSTGSLTIDQVTVSLGGILATNGTLTNNSGNLNVNGSLQINQGGYATGGTYVYGSSGTLIFNNTSGSYGVNSDHIYWPSSNGPVNVTVQGSGGITLNSGVNRTVTGTFQTSAGVSVSGGSLTINGINQINANGAFNFSPTYGSNSTLVYNSGGTYGRFNEWSTNNPNHVLIANNTTLNLSNGSNTARVINGNLTVESGSQLTMQSMTGSLTVMGNVTNSGTITLSTASGGDIYVGGNWTRSGGTFNNSSRAIFFNGTGTQVISVTGGGSISFDYLVLNKTSGSVQLSSSPATNATVTASTGDVLQLLNAGSLDLNGQTM